VTEVDRDGSPHTDLSSRDRKCGLRVASVRERDLALGELSICTVRARTLADQFSTRDIAHEEPTMSGVLHGRLACVSASIADELDDEPTSTRLLPRHDDPSNDNEVLDDDDDDEPEREVIVWARERRPRMQH
jgi:hypothetical protein